METADKLEAIATKLADHLNGQLPQDDWYSNALDETGAAKFYDEERTVEADPSGRSDTVILSDSDTTIEVYHDQRANRWRVIK